MGVGKGEVERQDRPQGQVVHYELTSLGVKLQLSKEKIFITKNGAENINSSTAFTLCLSGRCSHS